MPSIGYDPAHIVPRDIVDLVGGSGAVFRVVITGMESSPAGLKRTKSPCQRSRKLSVRRCRKRPGSREGEEPLPAP